MKVQDIITRVRNIAGDTNTLQFTDAQVLDWINDGVRECAIQNNLLQKRATSTVTSGTAAYALPVDILKLHSVRYDGAKLSVKTLQEFEDLVSGTDTSNGTPQYCYVWAGFINLYPAPDNSTSVMVVDYSYDPATLLIADVATDTPALPVGYHARLVDYCLAQVAQQDDDLNRYQMKMQEFTTGVQNLKDLPEWENDLYPSISISPRDMGEEYYG